MKRKTINRLIWVMIFAISMGFFESSIVVYLREIYYPDGFSFPLQKIAPNLAVTEFIREAASIVMIVSVAGIAFNQIYRRFAAFLFIFAIWDIFYYVFLKLLLNWPESLMTWDILFLIPVTWTGPVITPVFIALLMLMLAFVILHFDDKFEKAFFISPREWILLVLGAFVVFVSFIWDYSRFVINNIELDSVDSLGKHLEILTLSYTPVAFNWILYFSGVLLILAAIFFIYRRNKARHH